MHLQARKLEPEEMDSPSVSAAELRRAHTALARMHRLSLAAATISREIFRLNSKPALLLLDVGCSDGWLTAQVAGKLERKGLLVHATGVDMSPIAIEVASTRYFSTRRYTWHLADAPELLGVEEVDVAFSSTFLHHLSRADALLLLKRLSQIAPAGVIYDLNRTSWTHQIVQIVSQAVTRSKMVHADARRSVDAAFTKQELIELARDAGLPHPAVRACFPCHLILTWKR